MHYCVWVIMPHQATGELESRLHRMMKRFEDLHWDWYQTGGRWTGMFDKDYNPEKDPANIEICRQCGGTGWRDDEIGKKHREKEPDYTCNGCNGSGKSVKWPTEWKQDVPGNTARIKDVRPMMPDITPYAILTPEGEWIESETFPAYCHEGEWDDEKMEKLRKHHEEERKQWRESAPKILERFDNDQIVIVVDCHN